MSNRYVKLPVQKYMYDNRCVCNRTIVVLVPEKNVWEKHADLMRGDRPGKNVYIPWTCRTRYVVIHVGSYNVHACIYIIFERKQPAKTNKIPKPIDLVIGLYIEGFYRVTMPATRHASLLYLYYIPRYILLANTTVRSRVPSQSLYNIVFPVVHVYCAAGRSPYSF